MKQPRSAVTSKAGVNYVRTLVENSGSLFIKIEHENDIGIDAIVELMKGETPLNRQIAIQIKSGQSYYIQQRNQCSFPISGHRDYWSRHPLPVIGIVFVPSEQVAYWVDIKWALRQFPDSAAVRFDASTANRLHLNSFNELFVPALTGTTPELSQEAAFSLVSSAHHDERFLGLLVLFRIYQDSFASWDYLINFFRRREYSEIPPILIYWLAHVPWHGDISASGTSMMGETTRAYARTLLTSFEYADVVKLLQFIDEENGISRGSLGQSVEAIISALPRRTEFMKSVISSRSPPFVRDCAAIILAIDQGPNAIGDIKLLADSGSWLAGELLLQLEEYGAVNPY